MRRKREKEEGERGGRPGCNDNNPLFSFGPGNGWKEERSVDPPFGGSKGGEKGVALEGFCGCEPRYLGEEGGKKKKLTN